MRRCEVWEKVTEHSDLWPLDPHEEAPVTKCSGSAEEHCTCYTPSRRGQKANPQTPEWTENQSGPGKTLQAACTTQQWKEGNKQKPS